MGHLKELSQQEMESALERVKKGVASRQFNSRSTSYMDDLKSVLDLCEKLKKDNVELKAKANNSASGYPGH